MDYQKIVALCMICLLGSDGILARPARRQKRSTSISADLPQDQVRTLDDVTELEENTGEDVDIELVHMSTGPGLSRKRRYAIGPMIAEIFRRRCERDYRQCRTETNND